MASLGTPTSGTGTPDAGAIVGAEYACAMAAVDKAEGCVDGTNRLIKRWTAYIERNETENMLESTIQRRDTEISLIKHGIGLPEVLAELEESVIKMRKRLSNKRKEHDRLRKGQLYATLAGVLCRELDRRGL